MSEKFEIILEEPKATISPDLGTKLSRKRPLSAELLSSKLHRAESARADLLKQKIEVCHNHVNNAKVIAELKRDERNQGLALMKLKFSEQSEMADKRRSALYRIRVRNTREEMQHALETSRKHKEEVAEKQGNAIRVYADRMRRAEAARSASLQKRCSQGRSSVMHALERSRQVKEMSAKEQENTRIEQELKMQRAESNRQLHLQTIKEHCQKTIHAAQQ